MNVFRYNAFISYRHVEPDRAYARWLHRALESYRVPKDLVASGFPKKLTRVFRDEEELPASADLSGQINAALEQSEFLIVICSPRVVESIWCDAEVQKFRELGRHDKIIALLIEGEPSESFLPSLCEIRRHVVQADGSTVERLEAIEPLAADVRPREDQTSRELKQMAKLRILACLLGCTFDDLRKRDQARGRKMRAWVASSTLLLLVLGLSAIAALVQGNKKNSRLEFYQYASLLQDAYDHLEHGESVNARAKLGELSSNPQDKGWEYHFLQNTMRKVSPSLWKKPYPDWMSDWLAQQDALVGESGDEESRLRGMLGKDLVRKALGEDDGSTVDVVALHLAESGELLTCVLERSQYLYGYPIGGGAPTSTVHSLVVWRKTESGQWQELSHLGVGGFTDVVRFIERPDEPTVLVYACGAVLFARQYDADMNDWSAGFRLGSVPSSIRALNLSKHAASIVSLSDDGSIYEWPRLENYIHYSAKDSDLLVLPAIGCEFYGFASETHRPRARGCYVLKEPAQVVVWGTLELPYKFVFNVPFSSRGVSLDFAGGDGLAMEGDDHASNSLVGLYQKNADSKIYGYVVSPEVDAPYFGIEPPAGAAWLVCWSPVDGKQLWHWPIQSKEPPVGVSEFSAPSVLSQDSRLSFVDKKSGVTLAQFEGEAQSAVNLQGNRIARVADWGVEIVDQSTNRTLLTMSTGSTEVDSIRWSADGTRLIGVVRGEHPDDNGLVIWNGYVSNSAE